MAAPACRTLAARGKAGSARLLHVCARPHADNRRCRRAVCPPGTFESNSGCAPCVQGSWCPGGNKNAQTAADDRGTAVSCNPGTSVGLTTKGTKASKASDCGAQPHSRQLVPHAAMHAVSPSLTGACLPAVALQLRSAAIRCPTSRAAQRCRALVTRTRPTSTDCGAACAASRGWRRRLATAAPARTRTMSAVSAGGACG